MVTSAKAVGAVHTHTHTHWINLVNKLDEVIKLNLIYKKIIEKLE